MLATARLSTPNGTPPTTTQQVTAPSTATPHHANLGPMVVLLSPVSSSKGTQPKTYQILKLQLLKPHSTHPRRVCQTPPAIIQTTFPIFPTTLIDRRGPPTTCGTDGNLYFTELAQDKVSKLQIKPTPAGPVTYFYNLGGA